MSWRSSLKTRMKQRKLQQKNQKTLNKKWRFAILATFFNYAIWPIWFWFLSRASHGIVTARSSCLQTNLDQYFINFQKSIRDGELNEFLLLKESEVESTDRKCVNFAYLDMLTLRIYSTYFAQKYQEQLSSWTVFTFGIIHVVRTQNFPKNKNFLPPDTQTFVCVSGGMKF